jgi:kynurenine formamidase
MSQISPTTSAALGQLNADSIRAALGTITSGRVISLETQWWRGMPGHPVHPRFEVLTYRSPRGERVQKDQDYLNPPANTIGYGFISELVSGTTHTGTHIDALCHVVCGDEPTWHGGVPANDFLGDFGALNSDASELPPIISRGVLLDVPGMLGLDYLAAGHPITADELQRTADAQGIELHEGDTVLVRTGSMQFWPNVDAPDFPGNSGVSLDGAEWLSKHKPVAVGADTVAFECAPSGIPGSSQPAHVHLIWEQGIPILELVDLEELAREKIYVFSFVCLPLTIQGATGSMVRPIAIL